MKRVFLFALCLLAASPALALTVTTGTVTVASVSNGNSDLVCERYTCTSNPDGGITATLHEIHGVIQRRVFNPGDGATSPTAAYDVTLTDADGVDVLAGTGANLSQSATTNVPIFVTDGTNVLPMTAVPPLTLSASACGNQKTFVLSVYVKMR